MKILFVCLGNSERSVIAEELYNKHHDSNASNSAGVKVIIHPRSKLMFKLMKSENINIQGKSMTQLTKKMLNDFERIFVLCKKEKCPKYLLNSKKVSFWNVPDPSQKSYQFLLQTKKIIKKYLKSIL